MDGDNYKYEIGEYKRKLNLMSEQVQAYEKQVEKIRVENLTLVGKINSMEKDSTNIRGIMTENITSSNAKEQSLLAEITRLREQTKG